MHFRFWFYLVSGCMALVIAALGVLTRGIKGKRIANMLITAGLILLGITGLLLALSQTLKPVAWPLYFAVFCVGAGLFPVATICFAVGMVLQSKRAKG